MIQRNTLGLCAVILLAATNAARASSDGNHPTYACTNVRWNEEFLQDTSRRPRPLAEMLQRRTAWTTRDSMAVYRKLAPVSCRSKSLM